jgi:hypothetical protein
LTAQERLDAALWRKYIWWEENIVEPAERKTALDDALLLDAAYGCTKLYILGFE